MKNVYGRFGMTSILLLLTVCVVLPLLKTTSSDDKTAPTQPFMDEQIIDLSIDGDHHVKAR